MKYAFQLALLMAFGGSVEASGRDGEPISGRVTSMTVPSYQVIEESPTQCSEAALKICVTNRVLDVLVLPPEIETDPIVWIDVADARKGRTNDPHAGQMQIKVMKPSYISERQLYRAFIETTLCFEPTYTECISTLTPTERIKTMAPIPE